MSVPTCLDGVPAQITARTMPQRRKPAGDAFWIVFTKSIWRVGIWGKLNRRAAWQGMSAERSRKLILITCREVMSGAARLLAKRALCFGISTNLTSGGLTAWQDIGSRLRFLKAGESIRCTWMKCSIFWIVSKTGGERRWILARLWNSWKLCLAPKILRALAQL